MQLAIPAFVVHPAAGGSPAFDDGVIGLLGMPSGTPTTSRHSFPYIPHHYQLCDYSLGSSLFLDLDNKFLRKALICFQNNPTATTAAVKPPMTA